MSKADTQSYDAIILGGGAAGLMCAAQAGKNGQRVLVLEKADRPGKKILISGGGRCNFTNLNVAPDRYISANRHYMKSALSRYTAQDFIALVDAYGIAWHEKTLGQLFCDGPSSQILDMLLDLVAKSGGEVRCHAEISSAEHEGGVFRVTTQNAVYAAPKLVIATGGPSIPKMGATSFAYDLARQFGLKVVEPRPALVPFTLGGDETLFRELSGVSADVIARVGKTRFREAALFTHKGLSGPAILQISSYWRHSEPVCINFVPDHKAGWLVAAKATNPRGTMPALLKSYLPDRLAQALADKLAANLPPEKILAEQTDKALQAAEAMLADWPFHPNGTEGFAKAEVTVGGISTAELSSKTMEAKRIPGLYAIGEAVDVTGWLGGYNFQWAWASGVAAGLDI